jgi:hypothetical protein
MENQVTIWQKTSERASKLEIIRHFASLTPEKIVAASFPSLGEYKRREKARIEAEDSHLSSSEIDTRANEKVEQLLKMLVLDLSASFNNCIKEHEAEEIAVEIMSSQLTRCMSPEDVYYALRQLKINNTHGTISINKILKAIVEHNALRMDIVTKNNTNTYLDHKHTMPNDRQSTSIENEVMRIKTGLMIANTASLKAVKRNNTKHQKQ